MSVIVRVKRKDLEDAGVECVVIEDTTMTASDGVHLAAYIFSKLDDCEHIFESKGTDSNELIVTTDDVPKDDYDIRRLLDASNIPYIVLPA